MLQLRRAHLSHAISILAISDCQNAMPDSNTFLGFVSRVVGMMILSNNRGHVSGLMYEQLRGLNIRAWVRVA